MVRETSADLHNLGYFYNDSLSTILCTNVGPDEKCIFQIRLISEMTDGGEYSFISRSVRHVAREVVTPGMFIITIIIIIY